MGDVRFKTGLDFTPSGVELAKDIVRNRYLQEQGYIVPMKHKPIRIKEAFKTFMEDHADSKEQATLDLYERAYRFIVGERDYFLSAAAVKQDMKRFKNLKHYKASSKAIYLRTFFAFLRWCFLNDEQYLDRMPLRSQFLPKVKPKQIKIYSPEERHRIFEYFELVNPELSLMLRFLFEVGARIHEVLSIEWKQIKGDRIVFESKRGDKLEEVPLTAELARILSKVPHRGEKVFRWSPNSASSLRRDIDKAFAKMGIEKDGRAFHTWRKSRWSDLMEKGVDPVIAAQIMRCSIQTARKSYIKWNMEKLKEVAEK